MGLWNTIRIALVALRLNKMRSFLTMLGIIIGIASVIVMVSVSSGSKAEIERTIDQLGSNMLSIRPGAQAFGRRGGSGSKPRDVLTTYTSKIPGQRRSASSKVMISKTVSKPTIFSEIMT